VFLGFAYHDPNMVLLKPPEELFATKRIFGTAFGMSESMWTSRRIRSMRGLKVAKLGDIGKR
jgi:hypothetical protein